MARIVQWQNGSMVRIKREFNSLSGLWKFIGEYALIGKCRNQI